MCSIVEDHLKRFNDEEWIAKGCLSKKGKDALKQLHETMIVAPTDKSAHDLMFACKSIYQRWMHAELATSSVYKPSAEADSVIWARHDSYSATLARLPVRAHSYLYGAGKLHKRPVRMRWIAGAAVQPIASSRNKTTMAPGTSISPLGAALGGALRLMMLALEAKDIKVFRPRGIKRYWIVTSVDTVAKHIKIHQQRLGKKEVWSRDFSTTYTMLDHDRLVSGVSRAVKEAFEYQCQRL